MYERNTHFMLVICCFTSVLQLNVKFTLQLPPNEQRDRTLASLSLSGIGKECLILLSKIHFQLQECFLHTGIVF